MTIACIDVGYTESESKPTTAIAACVAINDWRDISPTFEHMMMKTYGSVLTACNLLVRCANAH